RLHHVPRAQRRVPPEPRLVRRRRRRLPQPRLRRHPLKDLFLPAPPPELGRRPVVARPQHDPQQLPVRRRDPVLRHVVERDQDLHQRRRPERLPRPPLHHDPPRRPVEHHVGRPHPARHPHHRRPRRRPRHLRLRRPPRLRTLAHRRYTPT